MKKIYALVFAAFTITACQNETETAQQQDLQQQEESVVTLTSSGSSTEFPDATLKSFTYDNGKFSYDYNAETYELGQQTEDDRSKLCANSGKGQHIHFIVNDEAYKAFYTADFENIMEDGEYHLLSFLSRSYHESIKNGTAHLAKKVTFEGGKMTASEDIEASNVMSILLLSQYFDMMSSVGSSSLVCSYNPSQVADIKMYRL